MTNTNKNCVEAETDEILSYFKLRYRLQLLRSLTSKQLFPSDPNHSAN